MATAGPVLDAKLVLGLLAGAGATWAVLQLSKQRHLLREERFEVGQLVNRSRWQKRHAMHLDVVDDEEDDEVEGEEDEAAAMRALSPHLPKKKATENNWQEKEDALIGLLFDLMRAKNLSLQDACEFAEHLIFDYLRGISKDLARYAPELVSCSARTTASRRLHTALPLGAAFRKYDAETRISSRKNVAPQFREVRNICNVAQVLSSAKEGLSLITFDGDGTLYPDRSVLDDSGADAFPAASDLIDSLVALMDKGVAVALCTAVGDPKPGPYEKRLAGLLRRIEKRGKAFKGSLYAVGGQCNYVFRYSASKPGFDPVPRDQWEPQSMKEWSTDAIKMTLDAAESALLVTAQQVGFEDKVKLVRKERAVGLLYTGHLHRSTAYFLDELALRARDAVKRLHQQAGGKKLPFCTFNGGRDVFVDVGTKEMGIDVLRGLVGASRGQTLHVGDQFTRTGNDLLARRACGTLWVDDPNETALLLSELLGAMSRVGSNASLS
mmetsp:Transcript_54555/g.130152  ORF Transcript_54555/g.130152 Transcript_54555/m.130152 type:complete len:495 (+) Transcript_54555:110-1594(+)